VALQRRPHLNLDSSEYNQQVGWSREQSTADLRAARYDVIIAGENWARFEQAELPQLAQERELTPLILGFSRHGNLGHI
jgi:hypothetical protein